MLVTVTHNRLGAFCFLSRDADDFPAPRIAGASVWDANVFQGKLIMEEKIQQHFSLVVLHFNFSIRAELQLSASVNQSILAVLVKGELELAAPANQPVQLQTNQYCFIPCTDFSLEAKTTNTKILFIFFDPSWLLQIGWLQPLPPLQPVIANEEFQLRLFQLFNNEFNYSLRDFYFENLVRELLFLILSAHHKSDPNETPTQKKIALVEQLISRDLQTHLTTKELARIAGINECTLKKEFRQHTSMSLFERLLFKRLEKAKYLLAETNEKVSAIGWEMGYQNSSAFSRAFKKMTGFTPLRWRALNKK